jgi:hypothetical protein
MPKAIQFSVEDLKTPVDLERVLRQFQAAITVAGTTGPAATAAPMSLAAEAAALAPLISQQLQLGGSAPLNLTGLLSGGSSALIEDTHANRLAVYTPPKSAGLVFLETDRNVLYASGTVAGAIAWIYAAGGYSSTLANQPKDLGANDTGFLFTSTDGNTQYEWNGTVWVTVGGALQKITSPSYQSAFTGIEALLSEGGAWSVVDSWAHLKKNNGVTAITGAAWSAAFLAAPVLAANQYCQITHAGALTAGDAVGVCVRLQSTANGSGFLVIELNNTLYVYGAVDTAGSLGFNLLLTGPGVAPVSGTNTLRIEMSGTVMSVYYNGALSFTFANGAYSTGRPGIAIFNGGGNPVITSADLGSLGGNFYVGGDLHIVGNTILDGTVGIYSALNVVSTIVGLIITSLGNLIWNAGTAFTGTLTHTDTGNRVYTFPDATGTMVYETAALTANQLLLGGGTSLALALGVLGTTTTVLHGNAGGAPSFGPVVLTTDVFGTLPAANGGTGVAYNRISDTIALTNQGADIAATAFANSATAGTYRCSYYFEDTTSDVTAGAVTLTVAFTDAIGATTVTSVPVVLTGLSTLRTSGVFFIQNASGNITYAVGHTGIYGVAKYALYACLERLS